MLSKIALFAKMSVRDAEIFTSLTKTRAWFEVPGVWKFNTKKSISSVCDIEHFMDSHIHPSKKVTQHEFDQLYSVVHGILFVMLGLFVIGKPLYMSFHYYIMFASLDRAKGEKIGGDIKI